MVVVLPPAPREKTFGEKLGEGISKAGNYLADWYQQKTDSEVMKKLANGDELSEKELQYTSPAMKMQYMQMAPQIAQEKKFRNWSDEFLGETKDPKMPLELLSQEVQLKDQENKMKAFALSKGLPMENGILQWEELDKNQKLEVAQKFPKIAEAAIEFEKAESENYKRAVESRLKFTKELRDQREHEWKQLDRLQPTSEERKELKSYNKTLDIGGEMLNLVESNPWSFGPVVGKIPWYAKDVQRVFDSLSADLLALRQTIPVRNIEEFKYYTDLLPKSTDWTKESTAQLQSLLKRVEGWKKESTDEMEKRFEREGYSNKTGVDQKEEGAEVEKINKIYNKSEPVSKPEVKVSKPEVYGEAVSIAGHNGYSEEEIRKEYTEDDIQYIKDMQEEFEENRPFISKIFGSSEVARAEAEIMARIIREKRQKELEHKERVTKERRERIEKRRKK